MRTKQERDEARRICEAATDKPWMASGDTVKCSRRFTICDMAGHSPEADKLLIAHARNTYIPLLDAYEEVERERDVLRRALEMAVHDLNLSERQIPATVRAYLARTEMEAEEGGA